MTQEEKELLLKDLCERALYSPTVHIEGDWFDDDRESYDAVLTLEKLLDFKTHDYILKPYLRPLSSLTKEEKKRLKEEHYKDTLVFAHALKKIATGDDTARGTAIPHFAADWCDVNHIDYRGMIEKGLALEAPEGMYKTE